MSKDSSNNGFIEMIGGLILVCFVGSVIWKVLSAIFEVVMEFFKMLLFFITVDVIPSVVFASLFGIVVCVGARLLGEIVKSKESQREFDFRAVIVVLPLLCWITYGLVGWPVREQSQIQEITIVKNAKGKVMSQVKLEKEQALEWSEIHAWHEKVKDFYGLVPKPSGSEANKALPNGEKIEPYDRADFAWIVWISLLIGAPILAGYMSLGLTERDDVRQREVVAAPLRVEIKKQSDMISKVNQENRSAFAKIREQHEEISKLKARDEFLTKREKEKASITDGILTSDKL